MPCSSRRAYTRRAIPPDALGIEPMRAGLEAITNYLPLLHGFVVRSSDRAVLAQKIKLLADDSKPRCGLSAKTGLSLRDGRDFRPFDFELRHPRRSTGCTAAVRAPSRSRPLANNPEYHNVYEFQPDIRQAAGNAGLHSAFGHSRMPSRAENHFVGDDRRPTKFACSAARRRGLAMRRCCGWSCSITPSRSRWTVPASTKFTMHCPHSTFWSRGQNPSSADRAPA